MGMFILILIVILILILILIPPPGNANAASPGGRWQDLIALQDYKVTQRLVLVFAEASGVEVDPTVVQEAFDELLYSAPEQAGSKDAVFARKMSTVDGVRGHSSHAPRERSCELSELVGHVRMKLVALGQGPSMQKMLTREQQLYQMKLSQLQELSLQSEYTQSGTQSAACADAAAGLPPAALSDAGQGASKPGGHGGNSRELFRAPPSPPNKSVSLEAGTNAQSTDAQSALSQYLETGEVDDPPLLLSSGARSASRGKPYSSEYCRAHLPSSPGLRLIATPVRPPSELETANKTTAQTIGQVARGSPHTVADEHAHSQNAAPSGSRSRGSKVRGATKRKKTKDSGGQDGDTSWPPGPGQGPVVPVNVEGGGIDRLLRLGELG